MSVAPVESLKIAHLITRITKGGAEENTISTCNASVAAGARVTLVYGQSFDEEMLSSCDRRVSRVRVPEMKRSVSPVDDWRAIGTLTRLLRDLKPDIVHTHMSKAGIVGRVAAHRAKVPAVIHTVHIAPFLEVPWLERLVYLNAEKAIAPWTDAFISVSAGMRDAYLEENIGDPTRHYVAYSGMDLARFRNARPAADWWRLLALPEQREKPPIVLMVAAMEARKRHVELVATFARVVAEIPAARLVLVGDGVHRPAVEAAVREHGLSGNVTLVGHSSRPEDFMAIADVAVHCAVREGLPRTLVQYVAAGLPVVATSLPGLEEIAKQGETAVIVGPDDFTTLGRALVELLADKSRRAAMATAARAFDTSRWELDAMSSAIHGVYGKVLADRPIGSR